MTSFKYQNRKIFKYLDFLISALNSYVLLIPFIVLSDFDVVARLSLLLSVFIFWQSLVRGYLVIAIFNPENQEIQILSFRKQAFLISIVCLPVFGLIALNGFSLLPLTYCAVTVIVGMQQEIFRQYHISRNQSLLALSTDLIWLITTTIVISFFLIKQSLDISTSLFAWMVGAIVCQLVALSTYKSINARARGEKLVLPRTLSMTVPIILSLLPVIQNISIIELGYSTELGLYRSIQILFLPAIFLINLQQPLLTESIFLSQNEVILKIRKYLSFALLSTILFSLILGFTRVIPRNETSIYLFLIVIVNIWLAFQSTFLSLRLLIGKLEAFLIYGRVFWLLSSCILIWLFPYSIILIFSLQTIIDGVFTATASRVLKKHKNP